ncbi:hypothetical protein RHMOL_Rhmol08G0105300 [Rhododendron molle]|uniref:Uncharacterized protein n=1 Tax=Rhododendron molle TaxID=49168 RepID=A0ACC0MNX4_RHOML|nr:hypothetical protein RHMOL_Rhmol08G0105300 [Rhododendron molle]
MGSPSQAVPMAQTGHSTADRNPYGNAPGDFPSFLLSKTIRQLSCAGNDQEGRLLQPFEHGMESIGHEFTHRVSCGDIGFGGIGVVSGRAIFGPPLDEYWKEKVQEEAVTKENDTSST